MFSRTLAPSVEGFTCREVDKTKIYDKNGDLVTKKLVDLNNTLDDSLGLEAPPGTPTASPGAGRDLSPTPAPASPSQATASPGPDTKYPTLATAHPRAGPSTPTTVHQQPDWLKVLLQNFEAEIITPCSQISRAAAEKNEYIEVG